MADNAEKKDIASLDFKIDDAKSKLEEINKLLTDLATNSKDVTNQISNNLNNAMKKMNIIDVQQFKNDSNNLVQVNQDMADKLLKEDKILNRNLILQNNKSNNRINEQNHRAALKQEENNNRVLKSTQTLYDKISEYAKTYIIYQGFNELRKAISETIDEMVDLEYQMVQIGRVLNESSLDIDKYRDKLIQLAYDYGNSFDNVADVTLRLAQAGFDSNESLALSEKTLLALNTAELNATQATEDMVAVMAQWGLMTGNATQEAKDYGDIIDKINKVADNYPTTSEDILEALKKTSSAFNLAGASIDETIATIVAAETASQRGGKAIGTALSNIIQQLKESKKIEIAEGLGIDFYTDKTKTQFKDIMQIFSELSEKMQQLKNDGKENSVEMQNLLSIFTVFRRNIGASLLGEMAGEDSTYAKVLKDSIDSVGYSIDENAKHMQTAKAAQAQFNAELLKLKTQVWDEGLENTFREMLNLGTDLIKGIGDLIDKFGLVPVSIGAITGAYTILSNKIKVQDVIKLTARVKEINTAIQTTGKALEADDKLLKGTSKSFKDYVTSVDKGKVSLTGYAGNLVKTTIKTALLTAGTIALNAALSAGISVITTGLLTAIDNWINANEKAIEKNKELIETSTENANNINGEIQSIQELRKEYEELAKKDNRSTEDNQKIYEIQEKINNLIKDSGKQVELVTTKTNEQGEKIQEINDKYDDQLAKIKEIEYEKKKQETEELKNAAEAAIENANKYGKEDLSDFFKNRSEWSKINQEIKDAGINLNDYAKELNAYSGESQKFLDALMNSKKGVGLDALINKADFSETYKMLNKIKTELESTGKTETTAYTKISNMLTEMKEKYNDVNDAVNKYKDSLSELYAMSGFIDTLNSSLQSIADSYDIEGPKKLIEEIKNINTEFSNGKINIEEYFNKIQEKISEINLQAEGKELEAYQAVFAATTQSLAEGLEGLISGLESGTINFTDYSKGVKEAADNTLELRKEQNNLQLVDGTWLDAAGNIDEYANSLQNAINEMTGMGDLLTTIGDNYDYIAEHADAAGQAIFNANDVGTKSYINLANSVADSLNKMKNSNAEAYGAITNDIFSAMGTSANEVANADEYITEALNGNAQALNAALNASASQVVQSTNKVTTSMGKVLSELGNAISQFNYTIKATPYISGGFGLETNNLGIPTKLTLPTFGFDINGTGGESIKSLGNALNSFGQDLTEYASTKFNYTQLKSNTKPYQSTLNPFTSSSSSSPSSSSPSSSGSSSKSTDTSEKDAQKAEEEAYKKRLSEFEDYITEKERLEKRWVDKQKDLGLLSNNDYLYITQQRIERYKKYLEEVRKATWMNAEDRLKLEKEYSEKIEDLQVDYLGYLQDQLNDEIKALEDANDKKIELIKNEADERINALKKVESENDRIRSKEEYEKKRQEHLDDISYWEQRTGREAQESLKEAKKNLAELDEEWKQTKEDWSIEDQIQQIEDERDAEVKAIEEAQKKEIESLQAVYDAKVKLFAETGEIIYEGSVIQAQSLYNAYKKNFIDPITSDLENLNKVQTPAPTPDTNNEQGATAEQQYETYTIKRGDTLSRIARNYGTTVDKLMEANPYITNKNRIYAGKTLQIPKFHEGGIFGGLNEEGLALLKKGEVILKPSWSESLNRMMKYFDSVSSGNTTNISNGPSITVKGDLIKVEASVRNQSDIDNIGKKVEKILKDKFNIKK